jgi:hypothetical protein
MQPMLVKERGKDSGLSGKWIGKGKGNCLILVCKLWVVGRYGSCLCHRVSLMTGINSFSFTHVTLLEKEFCRLERIL